MASGDPMIDPNEQDHARASNCADDAASPLNSSEHASPPSTDCDVETPGETGIQQPVGHEITDLLAAMIESPFLDRAGVAYCRLASATDGTGLVVPLRDRKVRSNLVYRFRRIHGFHPSVQRVTAALDYVEGRLMDKRQADPVLATCPVWKCFSRVLEDEDSGCASAGEILEKLRGVQRSKKLLKGKESLPATATAMGKWLKKHQLTLRGCELELSRPSRRSTKRLWAWQFVEHDDARDTLSRNVSPNATGAATNENTESETPHDRMSVEELREDLGDLIDDSGD